MDMGDNSNGCLVILDDACMYFFGVALIFGSKDFFCIESGQESAISSMATGGIFMSDNVKKVIYLARDEEIDEIIQQVKESSEKSIVLVLTSEVKALKNPVNVKLLRYYAEQFDKQLQVVSDDKLVLSLCAEHGIKRSSKEGFSSSSESTGFAKDVQEPRNAGRRGLGRAFRSFWSRVRQRRAHTQEEAPVHIRTKRRDRRPTLRQTEAIVSRKRATPSRRYGIIVAFVFLVLLGATYAAMPKATIVISPTESVVSDLIVLRATVGAKGIDYDNWVIPATSIEASFDADITIPTSGSMLVGKEAAQGTITFINESESPVTVKAGTVLCANSGVQFQTLEDVTVPAARVDYLMDVAVNTQAGRVETLVRAVQNGTLGNVAEGQIRVIENNPLSALKIINLSATSGGEDRSLRVVSLRDTETAKAKLDVEIRRRALSELGRGLSGEYVLVDESLKLKTGDVLFDKSIDFEATEVTAVTEVYAQGTIVRESDLLKALRQAFAKNLPTNTELSGDGLVIRDINVGMLDEHDAQLVVYAEGRTKAMLDTRLITQMLKGLSVTEAVSTLSSMGSISQFEVLAGENDAELPKYPFLIRVVVAEGKRK